MAADVRPQTLPGSQEQGNTILPEQKLLGPVAQCQMCPQVPLDAPGVAWHDVDFGGWWPPEAEWR